MGEVKRQARKLNFLITQTKLYSYFVGNKIKTKEAEESADTSGAAPTVASSAKITTTISTSNGNTVELSDTTQVATANKDLNDEFNLHARAAQNALKAVDAAKQRAAPHHQGLQQERHHIGRSNSASVTAGVVVMEYASKTGPKVFPKTAANLFVALVLRCLPDGGKFASESHSNLVKFYQQTFNPNNDPNQAAPEPDHNQTGKVKEK
ncbi:adenosinetriphosphatase [Puccinia sorghi]|uniref:Adenosinetriphosphatase n=1 Tax=Puccinia sorghi TaxID=27349 RepID=A0A0L6V1S6_9BASI|nr:adenosinetriphosphatase [Puccinia sorghi]